MYRGLEFCWSRAKSLTLLLPSHPPPLPPPCLFKLFLCCELPVFFYFLNETAFCIWRKELLVSLVLPSGKNRSFAARVSKKRSNVMFITLTSYKIVWKTSEICRSCDFIKSLSITRVSTYTNGNFWLSKLMGGAMRGIQSSKMSTALSLRCALSKYKLYYFSWLCFRNKEDYELKNEWWDINMSVSGHPATLGRFKPERRKSRGKYSFLL